MGSKVLDGSMVGINLGLWIGINARTLAPIVVWASKWPTATGLGISF